MAKKVHTAASGHRIEYEPSPKVAAFLARLEAMVEDPKVSEAEFIALAYSKENPMLDSSLFPTRGAVTKDVLADPAYSVMTDLLFRKSVQQEGDDLEQIASQFSVTVPDASRQLGVHENTLRKAIKDRRLASWVKNGSHYLDPRDVRAYEVGNQGGRLDAIGGPLEIVMGKADDEHALKVRAIEKVETVEKLGGGLVRGRLGTWKRIAVMTTGAGGAKRAFVLEEGSAENELPFGACYVRGRFRIAEKANSSAKAEQLFKTIDVA